MVWADGSNCSASDSGVRPFRTSSMIRCRNSGGYGGRLFGIVDSSPHRGTMSTEAGQLHKHLETLEGPARVGGLEARITNEYQGSGADLRQTVPERHWKREREPPISRFQRPKGSEASLMHSLPGPFELLSRGLPFLELPLS